MLAGEVTSCSSSMFGIVTILKRSSVWIYVSGFMQTSYRDKYFWPISHDPGFLDPKQQLCSNELRKVVGYKES